VVLAGLFAIRPLRRAVITRPIFSAYRKVLPQMSDTERDALEAGTVWWEGELFRGKPDWQKLHAYPVPADAGRAVLPRQRMRRSLPPGR
jgi:acyl-CoA dehydrogenase